ncbi:hypothetical protein [Cellulomonas humilata]|uniref:Uncharacterized protein n=1 Tax=Cellulomonas humilata TaxID=144055 RepID=A0ABU0ELU3_9CELL|nr:hypothetical protein [Cellulomonas humilata]MDQ0375985.1 hypothetical protein [Cellulomonas humilata]
MAQDRDEMSAAAASDEHPLFHSATGTRLHLQFCPHFFDTDHDGIFEAAADDARPVCAWSADEIAGVGQRRFDTFDDALRAYRAPIENRERMHEVAGSFTYDKIWMPRSGSYIGIAVEGTKALAYFGMTYLWTADLGTETLKGYIAGTGTGDRSPREFDPESCPTCHLTLPAIKVCDECG